MDIDDKIDEAIRDIIHTKNIPGYYALVRGYDDCDEAKICGLYDMICEFAEVVGGKVQKTDSHRQETAANCYVDVKNELRASIEKALEDVDPKHHRRLKNSAPLLRAHMKSHTEKAENIVKNMEQFWTENLKSRLEDDGVRKR